MHAWLVKPALFAWRPVSEPGRQYPSVYSGLRAAGHDQGKLRPCCCHVQARVEAAGGQILFWNGVRVMGVLAVSRAIGDHCLRPFVIAQPEVGAILLSQTLSRHLLILSWIQPHGRG